MKLALIALLLAAPAAASARDRAAEKPSPLIGDILSCAAEKDDAKRLACYDRAAATLAAADKKGDVVVVDREDVRKTRRALFGFNAIKVPFFHGDRSQDEVAPQLETTISAVKSDGYDKFYLTLADGSVWKTTEPARFDPKPGQPIRIKRGGFGSFYVDGGRLSGIKVIRLQ